jgi:hypothetical protein
MDKTAFVVGVAFTLTAGGLIGGAWLLVWAIRRLLQGGT